MYLVLQTRGKEFLTPEIADRGTENVHKVLNNLIHTRIPLRCLHFIQMPFCGVRTFDQMTFDQITFDQMTIEQMDI